MSGANPHCEVVPSGEVFFDTWLMSAPGRVFLAAGHRARILDSWEHFRMPGRPDFVLLQAEVDRQARRCPGPPWRMRIGFHRTEPGACPWRIQVEPFAWLDICPRRAWRVGWLEIAWPPEPSLWRYKSRRNRTWSEALQLARRLDLDDTLIASPGGLAAEFSRGNLFVIEGGALITPPEDQPVLPGVMRQAMLESDAPDAREESISWDRLLAAEGVLFTNSLRLLVPIGGIVRDGVRHPLKISPRTQELQSEWRAGVASWSAPLPSF